MSELVRDRSERLNEDALVLQHLVSVQGDAAQGYFGEQLQFLAGLEIEFALAQSPPLTAALTEGPLSIEQEIKVENNGMLRPSPSAKYIYDDAEKIDAYFENMNTQAKAYIGNLVPQTAEEAAKQQRWLDSIDQFTLVDYINFRLYQEFSTPTLGTTAPPKGATYDGMRDYADKRSWIEFRFGNGTLQDGYYDNPGVCELRLTPCPPDELARRERTINRCLADIAAETAFTGIVIGKHVNLSVYGRRENDGEVTFRPLINNPGLPQSQSLTIDAVSGITAAIEDGAWMTSTQAQDKFLFGQLGENSKWSVGPTRQSIRILQDYVELREKKLITTTPQSLLWLMAGMTYGLEHGSAQLASEGHAPAEYIQRHMVSRTENFDKQVDLGLQRALESAQPQESGGFRADSDHNFHRANQLADSIFGPEILTEQAAFVFNILFLSSLDVGPQGKLSLDPKFFASMYHRGLAPELREHLVPQAIVIGLERMAAEAAGFLARDAVRVENARAVTAAATYPGLEPSEWVQCWKASPIVRRAYGEHTDGCAEQWLKIAERHYEPLDLTDVPTYRLVIKELLLRMRGD